MHPFNVTDLLRAYLLLTYLLLQFLVSIKYYTKNQSFIQRGLVLTALCTLDMQHLFHWTRSVTIERPRPHSGLLQDVGCYPTASLSFNVNDLM